MHVTMSMHSIAFALMHARMRTRMHAHMSTSMTSCMHTFTRRVRMCVQVAQQLEKKEIVLDKLRTLIARLQEENRSVSLYLYLYTYTYTYT